MLNRILTLALMLSVVICCIFVFTEDPPELERTGPLPILMYHDVTDGPTSDNPMVVTTEKLEGDLCWLKENGYHTILPRELTAGEPLPPQAFTTMRRFGPVVKPEKTHGEVEQSASGKLATFYVRILFRQNASWQGTVLWSEGGQEERFRSAGPAPGQRPGAGERAQVAAVLQHEKKK